MEKKVFIIYIALMLPRTLQGSSIFFPDSDTALLFELVTTTISQLNELERLVSNAERLSGNIQKYNELAIDHWYRAQRVAHLVEDLSSLSNSRIQNLGELNTAIRQLKYTVAEFEGLLREYGIITLESKKLAKALISDDQKIKKERSLAKIQIERAHKVKTLGNSQKINTQINAYANKNLIDLKLKANQQIKLLSEQTRMSADERRSSIGQDLEKLRFYQSSSTRSKQRRRAP